MGMPSGLPSFQKLTHLEFFPIPALFLDPKRNSRSISSLLFGERFQSVRILDIVSVGTDFRFPRLVQLRHGSCKRLGGASG